MEQFLQAKILRADLVEVDAQFTEHGVGGMNGMVLLKHSLISISSLFDFEITIREMYQKHPSLNLIYKRFQSECRFAKYLRNKFSGHLKQDLVNKSLEWNPIIMVLMNKSDDPHISYAINQLILETAINTYVDQNGVHMLFNSETDLNYPPDIERFLKFMTLVIRSSISFLDAYLEIEKDEIKNILEKSSEQDEMFRLAIQAGMTDFKFIKK